MFFNSETGKAYEINYKFTESESYIESHIQKHPDVPVIATPEVAEKINSPLVIGGHHEYDTVIEISEKNFEQLLIHTFDNSSRLIDSFPEILQDSRFSEIYIRLKP